MNFSDLKRYLLSLSVYLLCFIFIFSATVQAADIQAQLDSSNGTSGLSVQNSGSAQVARVDSNGNLTAQGNVGVGTSSTGGVLLYVSPQGEPPTFVGAGDAYIQNNLEVDGITYLNDVYINGLQVNGATFTGNVGIGTIDTLSVTGGAFLATTSGNVGIGTLTPNNLFAVGVNSPFQVNAAGAIAAVTGITTSGGYTQSGTAADLFTGTSTFNNANDSALFTGGNVGIGSLSPGEKLDVQGTVRAIGFTMSGQTPVSGYVLTAIDSQGDTTWSVPGVVGGWTVLGPNVYETGMGNVGIGTSSVTQGSLVVTNGNVGIGTWAPNALLSIGANALTVNNAGAVTTSGNFTQSGVGINTFNGNIGIGTSSSNNALSVLGGAGLGSYATIAAPAGGIIASGNVGVGSSAPGQALDVQGTVRAIGFTMSGQTPVSGYVLTAIDSQGDTTWSVPGVVGGWTVLGPNVYETGMGNVGIGTSSVTQGSLVVTNGNVGIGTWTPSSLLAVGANALTVDNSGAVTTAGTYTQNGTGNNFFNGNIGIGTTSTNNTLSVLGGAGLGSYATIAAPTGGIITSGNVGIGSSAPGQALDVQGTVRAIGFTMSGQTPISGYVLTAIDTEGDTTWSIPGIVGGWTVVGSSVYETSMGNVGIGTSTTSQGALVVTNGNVGIGTWAPSSLLSVGANTLTVNSAGAIATAGTYTQSGTGDNVFNGNIGIGTSTSNNALSVLGGASLGSYATIAAPAGGLIASGNVGISSSAPGQALDVQGTVRAIGFTMSGQTPISGYVLTAIDTQGDTTWSIPGIVGGWTVVGSSVYETSMGNVGIGTSTTSQGALVVTNGNVGIGTWAPNSLFAIGPNALTIDNAGAVATSGNFTQSGTGINTFNGNIGIGTSSTNNALSVLGGASLGSYATIAAPTGGIIASGNVGVGSSAPGQSLDVQGTVRAIGFTMSGQTPISGYVLTAIDTQGDTTWSIPGVVGGWTVVGNSVYETSMGNVGIGTSTTNQGALVVTNGNVGIGTWAPNSLFAIGPNALTIDNTGAVATSGNFTQSGTGLNTFNGNIGIGTSSSNNALSVLGGASLGSYATTAAPAGGLIASGNVGIGTSTANQGALVVTSGNVGIGTWAPSSLLSVGANTLTINSAGAIATAGTYTQSGIGNNVFNGNIGIGTSTSNNALSVLGGASLGSYATIAAPAGGLIASGNVGISSSAPGQALDVQGTVRAIGFTMSGQTPISGYVLTAIDTQGDTTWSIPGIVGGWTVVGSSVYETSMGNVGIGTSTTSQGALVVTNGNVGIGTWAPSSLLSVGANTLTVNSAGAIATAGTYTQSGSGNNVFNGNIGIGTITSNNALSVLGGAGLGSYATIAAPAGGIIASGNVGVGSSAPGQALDVQGTVRAIGFTMSGQTPISGYVLTAIDTQGDTTWSIPGVVGGWTVVGSSVYETSFGNVGIGTSTTSQGALVITNGNVGIGTWAPINSLDVNNNEAIGANYAGTKTAPPNGLIVQGNVGFGTASAQTGLAVLGNVGVGTWTAENGKVIIMGGNVGIGTNVPPTVFAVGPGIPTRDSSTPIAFFGSDVEVNGNMYANAIIGGETLTGNIDLQGHFLTSSVGDILLGMGGTPDLAVTPGGNVGIGTSTSASELTVNGGVAIGTQLNYLSTLAPANGLMVQGNVGIGSTAPGQALDIQGTVRAIGFTMSGQTPVSGYVLTAIDSQGNTTWSVPGLVGGWTVVGSSVYETSMGNVGIGTSTTSQGAFVVTNGNVGIGTWAPSSLLSVGANTLTVNSAGAIATAGTYTQSGTGNNVFNGNIGIGTSTSNNALSVLGGAGLGSYATIAAPAGGIITSGNVGVGSSAPGQALDVQGTVRAIGFTMSGQTPVSGYVLTAIDSQGNTTWSVPGLVGGWTVVGSSVYETSMGNVGIGTSTTSQGALVVTNGNVGIGTWAPSSLLSVGANTLTVNSAGAIATAGTYTQSGTGNNVFNGNIGIGTSTSNNALSVLGGAGLGSYATIAAPAGGIIASGNVGVGSSAPGQALDVQGTVRAIGFTMSGQTPISGYVLTAIDTQGDTTWSIPGMVGGWTVVGSSVYETSGGNVGIGTSANQAALSVMNGNVGIGTWTAGGGSLIIKVGNVGIGSAWPGQMMDVQGTVRDLGEIVNGNVGIGTSAAQTAFAVTNGNVGIGTWTATNQLSIVGGASIGSTTYANTAAPNNGLLVSGNVGVGSLAPGQALDVQGTVRAIGFTMSGQTPISGYVLTAIDTQGDTTWSIPGVVGGWTVVGSSVYETSMGNVGIGTSTTSQGALVVTNGNVGIGTWAPSSLLSVGANTLTVNSAGAIATAGTYTQSGTGNNVFNGNIGIGTSTSNNALSVLGGAGLGSYATIAAPAGGIITSGNVGVGSSAPGQALDVQGTVRAIGFTMSGQTPISGYVLTAIDTQGDTTWSIPGVVGGWTVVGSSVYETSMGNVGIGTSTTSQGALVVTNGNVGIGTWAPSSLLSVGANTLTVNSAGAIATAGTYTQSGTGNNVFNGNIGIGTSTSNNALSVLGGAGLGSYATIAAPAGGIITSGNVGVGSSAPGQALDVQGTVRAIGFTMSGQTPISGYVLTAIDTQGDTTWSIPGVVGGWTVVGSSVYETSMGNVGIGTSTTSQGALVVTNGNVGIGTWAPSSLLSVGANTLTVNSAGAIATAGTYTQSGTGNNVFNGNIGIGTSTSNNALSVLGGAGLGSYATIAAPAGGIITSGNVGVGSSAPGQALDVQGTVRAIGFTMSGQTPISGYVLTAIDTQGDTTWSIPGVVGGWTVVGSSVYETSMGNVGIGTSTTSQGALVVTNGNVGIGTWAPSSLLSVGANTLTVNSAGAIATAGTYTQSGTGNNVFNGNIGIGTTTSNNTLSVLGGAGLGSYATIAAPAGGIITSGNVGVGSSAPGQALDVQGTVRAIGFTMSGQTPISGYVLTAIDTQGDTTWSIPGIVGGWTVVGSSVYETSMGNVGIGTSTTSQGALVVTNGNVGIGTWAPSSLLSVGANTLTVNSAGAIATAGTYTQSGSGNNVFNGNIGIGTITSNNALSVLGGAGLGSYATIAAPAGGIIASGNVGVGSSAPGQALDVQGTVRAIGFTMSGQTPVSGYVLTATDGNGDTTWSSSGSVGGWTVSGSGVYETSFGNVGIGTSSTSQGAFVVTNGNVGIGTWAPSSLLSVGANTLTVNSAGAIATAGTYTQSGTGNNVFNGNIGIGTSTSNNALSVLGGAGLGSYATIAAPAGGVITSGNVGVGSSAPGQALDVQGTVRAIGFTMSGQTPISGYVLTAVDSQGDTTWSIPGVVGGWTVSGSSVYETSGGNVGIGTSANQAALSIMNGNVGIGTWAPATALQLNGTWGLMPSGVTNVSAGGTITVTNAIMRIQGNGAPVSTASPQIAAGVVDGQMVELIGNSSVNTVKLSNGNGLKLCEGISFTMGSSDTMVLVYDASHSVWSEISRTH